jgi:hypothetical protein
MPTWKLSGSRDGIPSMTSHSDPMTEPLAISSLAIACGQQLCLLAL